MSQFYFSGSILTCSEFSDRLEIEKKVKKKIEKAKLLWNRKIK